jgi:hypothetical protein
MAGNPKEHMLMWLVFVVFGRMALAYQLAFLHGGIDKSFRWPLS